MPKSWQEQVREIVDRSNGRGVQDWASKSRVRRSGASGRGFFWGLESLGSWIRCRFSTTGDMCVTGAVLVVMALFLSIVLPQIASMCAVLGALVFAAALFRGFAERRRGDLSGSSSRRSVVWRGRIIEIQESRLSFAERVRRAVRRWYK